MSDPRRWMDEAPSDLARALLEAAREEAPSDKALRRTLTAVSAGAAAVGSATAAGATSGSGALLGASSAKLGASGTAGLFMKWAGVGLATGLAAAGVTEAVQAPDPPRAVLIEEARSPSTVPVPMRAPTPTPTPTHPPTPVHPSAPTHPPTPVHPSAPTHPPASVHPPVHLSVPTHPPASVHSHPPAPPGRFVNRPYREPSLLAQEIAAIDRAREALAQDHPSRALTTLDAYERGIPSGQLAPEALYLRAEALSKLGRLEEAAVFAQRLLRTQPQGPHALRARAIANRVNP